MELSGVWRGDPDWRPGHLCGGSGHRGDPSKSQSLRPFSGVGVPQIPGSPTSATGSRVHNNGHRETQQRDPHANGPFHASMASVILKGIHVSHFSWQSKCPSSNARQAITHTSAQHMCCSRRHTFAAAAWRKTAEPRRMSASPPQEEHWCRVRGRGMTSLRRKNLMAWTIDHHITLGTLLICGLCAAA